MHPSTRTLPEFNTPRPIALIGFMGTGKSAVGRRVARKLKFSFIDTDYEVEQAAGISIAKIFERDGEQAFREMEARALQDALGMPDAVISTGGGITTREGNRLLLRQHAAVVLLLADPYEILNRVQPLAKRPLLASAPDPLKRISELLAEREEFYTEYHLALDTTGSWPQKTAAVIVDWYREATGITHKSAAELEKTDV